MSTVSTRYDYTTNTYVDETDTTATDDANNGAARDSAGRASASASLVVQPQVATTPALTAPNTAASSAGVGSTQSAYSAAPLAAAATTATVTGSASLAGLETSVPQLPDATGSDTSTASANKTLAVLGSMTFGDTEAFRILQEAAQKNWTLDSTLTRGANQGVITAKLQSYQHTKEQIAGEHKSAVTNLAFGIAGSVASGAAGFQGAKMRMQGGATDELQAVHAASKGDKTKAADDFVAAYNEKLVAQQRNVAADAFGKDNAFTRFRDNSGVDKSQPINATQVQNYVSSSTVDKVTAQGKSLANRPNYGAGLDGMASTLGNVTTQLGQVADKLAGGQAEADQAKINLKMDDINQSLAQQIADQFKGNKDKDRQNFDSALDSFKDYFARRSQVGDKW